VEAALLNSMVDFNSADVHTVRVSAQPWCPTINLDAPAGAPPAVVADHEQKKVFLHGLVQTEPTWTRAWDDAVVQRPRQENGVGPEGGDDEEDDNVLWKGEDSLETNFTSTRGGYVPFTPALDVSACFLIYQVTLQPTVNAETIIAAAEGSLRQNAEDDWPCDTERDPLCPAVLNTVRRLQPVCNIDAARWMSVAKKDGWGSFTVFGCYPSWYRSMATTARMYVKMGRGAMRTLRCTVYV